MGPVDGGGFLIRIIPMLLVAYPAALFCKWESQPLCVRVISGTPPPAISFQEYLWLLLRIEIHLQEYNGPLDL